MICVVTSARARWLAFLRQGSILGCTTSAWLSCHCHGRAWTIKTNSKTNLIKFIQIWHTAVKQKVESSHGFSLLSLLPRWGTGLNETQFSGVRSRSLYAHAWVVLVCCRGCSSRWVLCFLRFPSQAEVLPFGLDVLETYMFTVYGQAGCIMLNLIRFYFIYCCHYRAHWATPVLDHWKPWTMTRCLARWM